MRFAGGFCPFLLLIPLLGLADSGRRSGSAKPNIVLILMDDMGYGDPGSYGATGYQTPAMDRLAAEGMRFTHFYAAQAVCTASRAALLTGCYPNRLGISGAFFPNQGIGLNPEEETIAELLKKGGYQTGMIGKWHLGNEPEFLPGVQGFDYFFGLPYSNDMWPVDYYGKPAPEGHKRTVLPSLPLISSGSQKGVIDTVQLITDLKGQAQLTGLYTAKAVEFIEKHRDEAFFLYLAHSMPHVPIAASAAFEGKSGQGLYGDVMMELDWSVGRILHTLEKLQLDGHTLVILTSDNGPWLNYGDHAGSSGGLREGKGTSFEGGIRVPCMMRWPSVIPEGIICNKLASTIDLLPTMAAIAGVPLPTRKIDGVDITPLLRNEPVDSPRKYFYYYFNKNDLQAVRTGFWKLVLPHKHRSYYGVATGRDGFPGLYNKAETGLGLYDLRSDAGEKIDVKDKYPEVVKALEQLAGKARQDLGDDLTGIPGTGRREIGKTRALK